MSEWRETEEPHPFARREKRFNVKVMVNQEGQRMVVDKATKKWFQYGPEELNRQFEEQYIHDEYTMPGGGGVSWRRIVPEAPIKMGSETRRADIAILRNENCPIEPSNYLVIIEVKKTGGDLEGAKAQLHSYMTNSNAFHGILSDLGSRTGFVKTITGKIIPADSSGSSKEDLLDRAELRRLPINKEVLLHAKMMRKLLTTVKMADAPEYRKRFVAFWLQEVKTIELFGQGSYSEDSRGRAIWSG